MIRGSKFYRNMNFMHTLLQIRDKIINATEIQFEITDTTGNVSLKLTYESTNTTDQFLDSIRYGVLATIGNITFINGPELTVFYSTGMCTSEYTFLCMHNNPH